MNGTCWPSAEQCPVNTVASSLHVLQKFENEARLAQTRLGNEVGHAKPVASTIECRAHDRQLIITTYIVAEAHGPARRRSASPLLE